MKSVRNPVMVFGAMVSAAAVAWMMAGPSSVAIVSLTRVMEGLEERAAMEADLMSMNQELETAKTQREDQLRSLEERMRTAADPDQQRSLREQLDLASLEYEGWLQLKINQIDLEQALRLKALYQRIEEETARMAQAEGYDVVLVDDDWGELTWSDESRASRVAQVRQQIRDRRMLFYGRTVDATDALVARMNNAFRVGRP